MAYWLVSMSEENWKANSRQGFTVYGMSEPYRRSGSTIRTGDLIVMSVMPARIAGVLRATIDGLSPLGRSRSHYTEPYPYAVAVEPAVILPPATWLKARELVPELGFAQGRSELGWRQCFRSSLRTVPEDDGHRLVARIQAQADLLARDPFAAATEAPKGWGARGIIRRHCATLPDGETLWRSFSDHLMAPGDAWRLIAEAGAAVPFVTAQLAAMGSTDRNVAD